MLRRFVSFVLASCLTVGAWLPAAAQMPTPPEIAAKAYLLVDVTSGQVLAAKDPDQPVEPASLTKLMTAYLVFDALKAKKITLTQTLPVSERAWKMPGSRMFIDPSMQVPVEDLIKGMIVQSGNDATVALAEGVGGSVERFVELMNQQAKALGMTNSSFRNPEGLTEAGHTMTARDLATLATRLMADFPEYVTYYSIQRYRYPGTPEANDRNRNVLLFRDPTVDGLKTGHTNAAGYCLVASAKRGETRLIAAVMGADSSESRAQEVQKMLNYGFRYYETELLFSAGQELVEARVWGGEADQISVGLPENVHVTIPRGAREQLESVVDLDSVIKAPINVGDELGRVKVTLDGETLVDEPVLALTEVPEGGLFKRLWDAIKLFFMQLFN